MDLYFKLEKEGLVFNLEKCQSLDGDFKSSGEPFWYLTEYIKRSNKYRKKEVILNLKGEILELEKCSLEEFQNFGSEYIKQIKSLYKKATRIISDIEDINKSFSQPKV